MFDRYTCINHLAQFESYRSLTEDSSVQARRRVFCLVANLKNKNKKNKHYRQVVVSKKATAGSQSTQPDSDKTLTAVGVFIQL